jgi:hypothetical protein
MWLNLAKAIYELRRTFAGALDPYRPELHYMRGPGPACRAKRAGTLSTSSIALEPSTLRQIANVSA